MKRPILLCIMDGFGLNPAHEGNAVFAAKKPNLDRYFKTWPNTRLKASGMAVGLPEGQMGNSEVGHTNIGAGRIVYQELTRISKSIADGDFFENVALVAAMDNCIKNGTALHLMGLLSDGGVHSHNTHLYALVELAKKKGLKNVYVHCFLDGRDVAPSSGKMFVLELAEKLAEIGVGKIASVMGRYYAMDRDNRWDRVSLGYNAIASGTGEYAVDAVAAVSRSYEQGVTDEFLVPTVITENGEPIGQVNKDDSVIFFNFRPDRAREITRAFVDKAFDGFKKEYFPTHFVCMTQYDHSMPNVFVAFAPQSLANTLGEYLSKQGLRQLRIAETEKYAHVTFFFNGGAEEAYVGEDRALIPSPKVATYDLLPEMSALAVTDELLKRIQSDQYDFIVLNYANCDMVGHTGIIDCAVKAVETVDACVGRVVDAVVERGGVALITADHGNADQMVDPTTHGAFTAHTTFAVPFIVVGDKVSLKEGGLADIAPTVLDIMGLAKPSEMSGESLIVK